MTKKQHRPTAGKIAADLLEKSSDLDHNAVEQTRENLTDYESKLIECLELHKKKYNGDFFIEVVVKKEKLMPNVIRNYFIGRISCPTPDYDQILYKYNKKDDQLDFAWVIPSRDTCFYLMNNLLNLLPEERDLAVFVIKFNDGTLLKLAKEYNKEKEDQSNIAIIPDNPGTLVN